MRPTVLTIGGSDSSGGAGIQADLKSIAANGGYGATAITAVTAQNTRSVRLSYTVPLEVLEAQLSAVFDDMEVAAVKTGMLASRETVEAVARALESADVGCVVCDPVLVSSTGFPLLDQEGIEAMRERLLPLADLVTPNADEAAILTGLAVQDPDDAEQAAGRLLELGVRAALVKGGHLELEAGCDVLVSPSGCRRFSDAWADNPHTHGSGCVYAAAIATWLARGRELPQAVELAKQFIGAAIRSGRAVGHGVGPTDPFFFLRPGAESRAWLDKVLR